jgi:4-hydroxy-tetrahydrodipicolinate synthase
MARFGSVVTAMVTPFTEDGSLDLDGAVTVARHLAANGSEGLVVAGTTGEGPVLSDDERLDLIEAVAAVVDLPVIGSSGTNDTAHSVALTAALAGRGAAGVLAVTPYYNRPSPAGIAAHFQAIAAATDLPVVLYDIPVRTGRRIGAALTVELANEVHNIVATKDSTGDPASAAVVVAQSPASFEVYCGDDSLTLPFLSIGAAGLVSVASHWAGPVVADMVSGFGAGRLSEARRCNERLFESYRFESTEEFPNPVPAKAACRALGLPVGQCRLPHPPAPSSLDAEAGGVITRLGESSPVRRSVA